MLGQKSYYHRSQILQSFMMLLLFAVVSSCMEATSGKRVLESNATDPDAPTTSYPDPTFPVAGLFVQEGGIQSASQFSLPITFTDSFLIRGRALSQYLKAVPETTKFCFVSKFTYDSLTDKFLILSARTKSYTDLTLKTTELYLQVEPANDVANVNDCNRTTLHNTIFVGATSPTPHYTLTQVCPSCSTTVSSEGFKLYKNEGEAVPTLNFSAFTLNISGTTSGGANMCVESSSCTSRGFSCCLDGQCIRDGAQRPDALAKPGFEQARIDVLSNPNRFVLYPEYYFVCASRPEDPGDDGSEGPANPDYEARVRLMEMNHLYQCLNKVDGEFSYCTVKFSSASQNITSGTAFSSQAMSFLEDINFQSLNPNFATGDFANNIVKVYYAGQTLYESLKKPLASADGTFTTPGNDDITTAQAVKIDKLLPVNALDDNLYLTFKIDGTCEKIGPALARCSKTYIQGSTTPTSTYYHNSTKIFNLPTYADTSSTSNIIVKISGVVVPEDLTTWSRAQNPNRISFSASYPLYQNQSIEITYYVSSNVANLLKAKTAAQAAVNTMCQCTAPGGCNITPILDPSGAVVNYDCAQLGQSTPTIPANQTVFVSNKNIPHRYFDTNGLAYDESYAAALPQEGIAFSYASGNLLKPSNIDTYTGFNEIYGSFSIVNPAAPKPAKLVKVKKDTIYDLYANTGVFSTCPTCGSDYYTSVKKIFPTSFSSIGGGYAPDNFDSARISTSGTYRSDDLLYGRACFIPATMIPWTHMPATDAKDQRKNRLAAQHFLHANGYTRDWYGFDYGSLIGSFDGLTWFSIGNQRRIKATSGKLFLAVNAYFGDLNVDSNFNVQVSETTSFSSALPDHDSETTGAECQKSHFCATDNDCFRQVGYDYTCQNISGITTNWPVVDASGTETVGSLNKSLVSIVGGNNGQAKRCAYRGRGAPCHPNLTTLAATFNNSTLPGLLACSPNTMCQAVSSGPTNRFNDRIARLAGSPVTQNSSNQTTFDTVGLGAKILGRPYDYYGTKIAPSAAAASLASNKLTALCIPGKNITASARTYALNSTAPATQTESSDKILGIGPTMTGLKNTKYLNACPATDNIGISIQQYDLPLGDPATINVVTTAQNLSTNLLDLAATQNIFSSKNGSQITAIGYQRNACLRAPGASCFSDMDCAPSEFIASRVKTATLTTVINSAEKKYWEEELICGNPNFKYSAPGILNTADFNIKNNVCCRDFGKAFSVFTQTATSDYHWCDTTVPGSEVVKVAGVNINIDSFNRYSRVHTAYDKMTCKIADVSSTKSFALSLKAPTPAARYQQTISQFKTLDTINERTCCTKNWVRQFSPTNGGGHKWSPEKMQTIDKAKFRGLNWVANNSTDTENPIPYQCNVNAYSNPSCEIRDFSALDTELYSKFFGALELVGIPQVALMSENFVAKSNNNIDHTCDPVGAGCGPAGGPGLGLPPDGTVQPLGGSVVEDFSDLSAKRLFSGTNYTALQTPVKKVFSENEFNCCVPSGQQVPTNTTADQCCTGNLANTGETTTLRCCLPDYTDVTAYLSRYVSSEGRGLPDSAYDVNTGYIKDPGAAKILAQSKFLCCSGEYMTGIAIRKLPIPLAGGIPVQQADAYTKRFTYLNNTIDNNTVVGPIGALFDAGVRWNNHVYCVPKVLVVPEEQ